MKFIKRRDIRGPVHLPTGAILSDPDKILEGPYYAKFVPEFLERLPDEDPSLMITEDLPDSTPNPDRVVSERFDDHTKAELVGKAKKLNIVKTATKLKKK